MNLCSHAKRVNITMSGDWMRSKIEKAHRQTSHINFGSTPIWGEVGRTSKSGCSICRETEFERYDFQAYNDERRHPGSIQIVLPDGNPF